ncbi:MAG: hypothetical protein LBM02_10070 [Lachnospiraceae bacterium]|jgi:hypothetical protein|nr:hypothetical protein [Lachnospiraceae bacterium]
MELINNKVEDNYYEVILDKMEEGLTCYVALVGDGFTASNSIGFDYLPTMDNVYLTQKEKSYITPKYTTLMKDQHGQFKFDVFIDAGISLDIMLLDKDKNKIYSTTIKN